MIKLSLQKAFPSFKLDLAFTVCEPGVTVLYGASGAGKTTVINMIAGLVTPDAGSVQVAGRVLYDSNNKINLPPEKRKTGYVFQDSRLFPHMTVKKNLLYGSTAESRDSLFTTVVELLGIEHILARYPKNLSGGEKQRTAIGRALLTVPDIMLMDEPMASLDCGRKEDLSGYIQELPKLFGIPVVYVTHSLEEIARLADNIGIIKAGEMVMFGKAAEILPFMEPHRNALLQAYNRRDSDIHTNK